MIKALPFSVCLLALGLCGCSWGDAGRAAYHAASLIKPDFRKKEEPKPPSDGKPRCYYPKDNARAWVDAETCKRFGGIYDDPEANQAEGK